MVWTSVTTLKIDAGWQYTQPVQGSYFRLKHASFPPDHSYLIAQVQLNADGSLEFAGSQQMNPQREAEIVYLKPAPVLNERRIAVKRVPKAPSLETILRRVLRNALLEGAETQIIASKRFDWQVAIEVSDYVEPVTAPPTGETGTTPGSTTTDPHFAKVVLLMPFDGADGSTTFTDVKNHVFTISGTPKISTAQSKFGGGSAYFNGGGTASTPDSEDWSFGTGDFTIETWVYRTGIEEYGSAIVSQWNMGGQSGNSWVLTCEATTANLAFVISTTGLNETRVDSGTVVPVNQWCHISVAREAGTLRFFLNGTQVRSTTNPESLFDSTRPLTIGGVSGSSSLGAEWQGYIDDLRITKGVARYVSNFSVPTTAFPKS